MGRIEKAAEVVLRAIPYFISAFLLFFCIGFLAGWGEREANARNTIYADIVYGTRGNGEAALHLACAADGRRYDFLVESNTLVPNSATLAAQIAGNPSEENQALRIAALAFFGGPMGTISYKTALDAIREAQKRPVWLHVSRIVGGVLGGISGYALGYWQGSEWRIGCDSDMGRFVISDEATWRLHEYFYFHMRAQEIVAGESAQVFVGGARNSNPMDDGPFIMCETPGKAILESFATIDDPGERDFRQLQSVLGAYSEAQASSAYRTLDGFRSARAIVERGGAARYGPLISRLGYTEEAFNTACTELADEVGRLLADAQRP